MKVLLALIGIILFVPISSVFAESMSVGKIYWEDEIVSPNSFVKITVEDDDMNKKEYPNFADSFTIMVWSDSSSDRIEIKLVETGVYSGIFTGNIFVSDVKSDGKKIFAVPGDLVYASYLDATTPKPDTTSEIIAAAVIKISGNDMMEYLEKVDPSMRKTNAQTLIPDWIKSNAGWWAEGTISDDEFLSGIEFLIKDQIITVSHTSTSQTSGNVVPDWIKSNAGWWAEGTISDNEFVNGIEHLIKSGLISVSMDYPVEKMSDAKPKNADSALAAFEEELEECSKITTAYKRIDCEKPIKKAMALYSYKTNGQEFDLGPVTYYWLGIGSEGNEFEITSTGQPILSIRMLAENTSSEIVALNCTSPQICSYDVWDGEREFKYSGMDFTSGQIALNPGDSREFNILFGPNIGYGGTEFEYDSGKDYVFRIAEPWGSIQIPLNLQK